MGLTIRRMNGENSDIRKAVKQCHSENVLLTKKITSVCSRKRGRSFLTPDREAQNTAIVEKLLESPVLSSPIIPRHIAVGMAVTWHEVLEPLPVESHRVIFSHGGTAWRVPPFKTPNKTHLHPRCILERTYSVITQALGPSFQFAEYTREEVKQRWTRWRSNQTDTEPENEGTVLDIKIPEQCIMHNAYS